MSSTPEPTAGEKLYQAAVQLERDNLVARDALYAALAFAWAPATRCDENDRDRLSRQVAEAVDALHAQGATIGHLSVLAAVQTDGAEGGGDR